MDGLALMQMNGPREITSEKRVKRCSHLSNGGKKSFDIIVFYHEFYFLLFIFIHENKAHVSALAV